MTQADINAWNAFAPGRSANLTQVNNLIINSRLPSGALPLDFFRVPVPERFATTDPNAFNITTLEGLKLYRSRQAFTPGFGTLSAIAPYQPRYIQFGIRVFF